MFTEKNVQALAKIESENVRYEKIMNELAREFDSALDCDRKSYDSKIDRLKSQNQVVASSFKSSKEHMFEDMDSKIKVDSDNYSNMIEVRFVGVEFDVQIISTLKRISIMFSHTPTHTYQVETRKGKKRRATLLSAAKSEFQKKLESMVQQMNTSQNSKMESLHDEYVLF